MRSTPLKPGQGSAILPSEQPEAGAVSVRTSHSLAKPSLKSNVIVLNYTLGQNHRRAQGPVPITLAPLCIFDSQTENSRGRGAGIYSVSMLAVLRGHRYSRDCWVFHTVSPGLFF